MNLEGIQNWLEARAPETDSPGVLTPDTIIGGWRVAAYLGHGNSSEVYRVVNDDSGGEAALKLLVKDSDDLKRRFINERKILSSLSPHIPELPGFYATGTHDGRLYYVMELLDPVELPLPAKRIAPFVLTLSRAVARLHAASYIHRDLKPANLMCRRATGEPVLIDLGLAKSLYSLEHDSPLAPAARLIHSQTSIVDGQLVGVGTPGWSAPEQLLEGKCSIASDVFALGKIARVCFRKRPPHSWRVIIRQATHQEPSERYPTVDAFIAAIRHRNLPLHVGAVIIGMLIAAGLAVALFFYLNPPPSTSIDQLPNESDTAYIMRLTDLATRENADAQCRLAECYFYGRHLPKDLNQANAWYLRAAHNGVTGAMVTLGDCYLNGNGFTKDPKEAIRWYRNAANRGDLGGQTNLGYCMLNLKGEDHNEAIRLIMDAAQQKHPRAQFMLGECYLNGLGVPKDPIKAQLWIQRAADNGYDKAAKLLKLL